MKANKKLAKEEIKFRAGNETLSGRFFLKDQAKPTVLFLHGGGVTTTKETLYYLAERLLEKGTASFLFDFSGHGKSTGKITESSLEKRLNEAIKAASFLDRTKPITISADSMSGHIAVKLLEHREINSLVLFGPAAYDQKAFKLKFGEGFSEAIRRKDSWKNSDIFRIMTPPRHECRGFLV